MSRWGQEKRLTKVEKWALKWKKKLKPEKGGSWKLSENSRRRELLIMLNTANGLSMMKTEN